MPQQKTKPRKFSSRKNWYKPPEQLRVLCPAVEKNMPISEIMKLPGLETRSYDSIRNKRNHIKQHRSRYKKYFPENMNDSDSNDDSNDHSNDDSDSDYETECDDSNDDSDYENDDSDYENDDSIKNSHKKKFSSKNIVDKATTEVTKPSSEVTKLSIEVTKPSSEVTKPSTEVDKATIENEEVTVKNNKEKLNSFTNGLLCLATIASLLTDAHKNEIWNYLGIFYDETNCFVCDMMNDLSSNDTFNMTYFTGIMN